MEARMQQPAMVVPDAMQPLQDLGKALRKKAKGKSATAADRCAIHHDSAPSCVFCHTAKTRCTTVACDHSASAHRAHRTASKPSPAAPASSSAPPSSSTRSARVNSPSRSSRPMPSARART